MTRYLRTALRLCLSMVLIPSLCLAQTTTGTIAGKVADAQGLALPGVTVSIAGPNLPGGLTVVASANGDYIAPLLPPGTYTLTFELTGFARQTRTVSIAPTQTLPVDVTMGPAGLTEQVNVVGSAANVLTQTAQVATNFSQELIAALPTTRDINAAILRAPSVHPTGPNGAYSIGGAPTFESLFMVNGVSVNENLRGQAFDLYIEDAIQETTVATSGVSAEFGRFSGGVVNVITKSGGNQFFGSFRDTLYNDNWRALTTGSDAHPFPPTGSTIATDTKIDKIVPQYEVTFGGPIVKDRLGFFFAGRWRNQTQSISTIAPLNIPYTIENRSKRYEIKPTFSLDSNHRFEGTFVKEQLDQSNDTFQTTSSMDLASLYNRQTPQAFFTINYRGVLTPQFFLEARYSQRRFSFVGSGAPTTDLIRGTLLIDRARGGRYWSPTFCGVCGNEQRDNDEEYIKGTYFLSTRNGGSHSIVAGYDLFNDKRLANNHQSGSDYRIIGTTAIIRNGVIYPQWNPGVSTVLQYNPIFVGSQGTNFRTHSLFFNDNWRFNSNLTFNLGLRWDKNNGKDAAGQLVVKDSAWSPRLGVVWDPTGTGVWSVTGSVGRYVAGIANSIADASAPGGRPANFQYVYSGPAINPDANAQTLVDSAAAIQQMFNWCNRDAQGLCRQPIAASSVPGVSVRVGDNLMSPNVIEYAAGISRQFGARATFRADYSYRSYRDFYASQIDTTTGVVTDPFGNRADLEVITNSNRLKRRYSGVTISGSYRINSRSEVGGNYTLSRLWGNFDGENTTSGPVTSTLLAYPEYKREEWFAPEGDLLADQRHRSGLWFLWGVPKLEGLTLSVLEDLGSGVPYGLAGTIDARSFVTNPGYATPQGGATTTYYYTARDAFRSEGARRTDVAALYNFNIPAGGRRVGVFVQAQVINLFDTQDMCACGGNVFQNGGAFASTRIQSTVQGPASGVGMTAFNPFTATPVEGVNFRYHPSFGTPLNRFAFTTPRMFRMNFGVRF